ncbi:alpha/beta hydrolase [Aminobacter sp. HY435]|uniref:alpha/beta hydrolase n=1 Tax=Aminobacter sp. HY435 TaxID=2970917 RepID=UPI0022B95032|nr:alpha/beta hydrolase [Aminobacter sp. HY435]
MAASAPEFIDVASNRIALRHQDGAAPGVVWLGGYKSDMLGTKAETLAGWCDEMGRSFLRHDYSGHGESGGVFADGTISKWLAESLAVFRQFTRGPQVLVGSSMGAWIALRMKAELDKAGEGDRVAGLVLLAPAPDFTAELVEPHLSDAQRRDLVEKGYFEEPSEYSSEPYVYTRALIEDGRDNLVMGAPIHTHCPVHIIQGLADPDVPHSHALKLMSLLPADDATLSLVPNGDHRLSRPEDLELMTRAVGEMIQRAG